MAAAAQGSGHGRGHRLLLSARLEDATEALDAAGTPKQRDDFQLTNGGLAGAGEGLGDLLGRGEQVRGEASVEVDDVGALGQELGEEMLQGPIAALGQTLDLMQQPGWQPIEALAEGEEDAAGGIGVGAGAMALGEIDLEALGNAAEAELALAGQEELGHVEGVVGGAGREDAAAIEEVDVEADVLAHERAIADELGELGGDGGKARRVVQRRCLDAGETFDLEGRRLVGAHEGLEFGFDAVKAEGDGSDLDDLVVFGVEAGGLGVEGDVAGAQLVLQGVFTNRWSHLTASNRLQVTSCRSQDLAPTPVRDHGVAQGSERGQSASPWVSVRGGHPDSNVEKQDGALGRTNERDLSPGPSRHEERGSASPVVARRLPCGGASGSTSGEQQTPGGTRGVSSVAHPRPAPATRQLESWPALAEVSRLGLAPMGRDDKRASAS